MSMPPDPFGPTSDNPLGRYDIPFEEMPRRDVDAPEIMYDQFHIEAGTLKTMLGEMSILRFHFQSSRKDVPDLPVVTFIASPDGIRQLGLLIRDAAFRAAKHVDGGRK